MGTWRFTSLVLLACLSCCWNSQASVLVDVDIDHELALRDSEPKDPWFRQVSPELIIDPVKKTTVKWTRVEPADFSPVAREKWPQAEAMLEKVWFYRLTTDQAQEFLGKAPPKSSGKTPYLVPALYFEKGPGEFYLSTLGKNLWIDHDSVGTRKAAMKRNALVVFLKTEPARLFVTCGRIV